MVKRASTFPNPQFPVQSEPRVWFLTSGSSSIGIALSRQLLVHGDYVAFGTKPGKTSNLDSPRATEFNSFWTDEVQVKYGWKDRAKVVELDGR